jgi:hypothetical protein
MIGKYFFKNWYSGLSPIRSTWHVSHQLAYCASQVIMMIEKLVELCWQGKLKYR